MNFIALHLASGAAFFEGIAMVAASLLMLLRFKHSITRSASRILFLVGIAVVAASSTPLPVWLQAMWCVLAFICMVLFKPAAAPARKMPLAIIFTLFSAALCIWESTYRFPPRIEVAPGRRIYVLGDSITAGLGNGEKTWPDVLAQSTHLNIVNLAQPGATLATALLQAQGIKTPHALVILEIGGNDSLSGEKAPVFKARLETLLEKLRDENHDIVMFELPLLPFSNGIGEAQRSLAAKYHVTLIPKRCMVSVLGQEGATVDGLHLSQKGQDALAQSVQTMLVMEPGAQ